MDKIKKATISLALHAVVYLLLYAWKVEGIEGAGNVLAAWCALLFVLAGCLAAYHRDDAPPVPSALPFGIGRMLSFGEAAVLLWFGHWIMFSAFLCFLLIRIGSEKKRREYRAAKAAGA